MSLGYANNPIPFTNRGVVQREDPALLQAGEYLNLENLYSKQEGALVARTGHQKLTPSSLASPIHSIGKMNIGGADASNPRYLGSAGVIYRTNSSYATSSVYSGLTSGSRWTCQQYNAGVTGKPAIYFATSTKSLKDANPSGTLYTALQNWGIDPPPAPVLATPVAPYFISVSGSASQRFINGTSGLLVGPNVQKIMAAGGVSGSPGYTKFTPEPANPYNGLRGIYVGQILQIIDTNPALNETILVLLTDATSFYAVTVNAHVAANIYMYWTQDTFTTAAAPAQSLFYFTGLSIDASFTGVAADGYNSDDAFHVALRCDDVASVSTITVAIVPGFTAAPPPAATDYYSYTIATATLMASGTATSPNWVEIAIPKSKFTKVGNAGTGSYTWKNVNQIYIIAASTAITPTIGVSDLYFVGGGGLNSFAAGTTNYDWLVTLRNPSTGNESNPCAPMVDPNLPPPILNGKATLTLTGISTSTANGNADYSGPNSIAVYRRGGSFADGLYRRVGFAANPGATTVSFIDNASDASLNTAEILSFDNDPPVRSTLPIPLTANILSFQSSGGSADTACVQNAVNRVVLTNTSTNFDITAMATIITPGTTISVGTGITAETAIVTLAGYNTNGHATSAWFECFLQYVHTAFTANPSEQVECGSINRGKCDLVCSDFDSIFLAGDANNPATLYQSKVGQPECFPVINLATGAAHQVNVGSPANPINGITSANGEIVVLNKTDISLVQLWQGSMQQPLKSASSRGLYAKSIFCKGGGQIWFLSYDGIYVWSGGDCVSVTEQISYMFRGLTVNGITPVDMTQALKFSMSFASRQLFFCYIDTAGKYRRLRYDLTSQRWALEKISSGATNYQIDSAYTEEDTGNALFGITDGVAASYLWLADFNSTSDGWVTLRTDGLAIAYRLKRFWPLGDPGTDYQVGELMMEIVNPNDAISIDVFYNYADTATETMTIASGFAASRSRYLRTVDSGSSTPRVAYSIGAEIYGTTGTTSTPIALFTFAARELKLEEVTTGPATDWDSLGHPYDKYLKLCSIEYDTGGQSIPVYLDTITGIAGTTQNLAVATFTLSGAGRSRQTFLPPDATIAKMIRLRPAFNSALKQFKFFRYDFDKENYPPDTIIATDWDASGYPCDKVFKWLTFQVDTGGVAASVALQVDGSTVNTFSVTGTFQNRSSIITLPSGIIGKQWRIVPTAGVGGKFQLFGVQADFEKDACAISHWDSLNQVLGSDGFKYIKQVWLDFQCAVPVVFSIYRDGGTLFYQETLPAQSVRAVARFFLPDYGVAYAFNKSKMYRMTLDSQDGTTGVKMYRDGCRVETRNLSGDQRSGYYQSIIWSKMPLAV